MPQPPPLRIGVLGTRRGIAFAEAADQLPGLARVTGFVGRDAKRAGVIRRLFPKARIYDSYEQMLDDDAIDAVVVANYADEHAPPALAALRAGKHVLSEVVAFDTIAQGVELARTVEKTGKIYFFGENFCYMAFVQEMRRLYESGALGEVRYAEGEYVHWAQGVMHMLVDLDIPNHWRLWVPPTFYCTHSVGPLLRITGERPVAVSASVGVIALPGTKHPPVQTPAVEIVRLANGAIVKSLHGGPGPREPWQPWFSIAGSKGCIESNRWPSPNLVTRYLDREKHPRSYTAKFTRLAKQAAKTQHWGADLFTLERFAHAARTGEKPDIDVYMGLDMTLVGAMGWRSVLAGSAWMDIPDLRKESVRKKWESDRYSCKPGTPKKYLLPNHATTGRTTLPDMAFIKTIRREQKREPYYKAMYRD
ncbi:MAG: Gfo/Idh/MocA family oxidoreductase [Planctomycetes bacterium]|nr:Gfo/Idh/MocA family oxidoreductase [Planctomycetota bacterium]